MIDQSRWVAGARKPVAPQRAAHSRIRGRRSLEPLPTRDHDRRGAVRELRLQNRRPSVARQGRLRRDNRVPARDSMQSGIRELAPRHKVLQSARSQQRSRRHGSEQTPTSTAAATTRDTEAAHPRHPPRTAEDGRSDRAEPAQTATRESRGGAESG